MEQYTINVNNNKINSTNELIKLLFSQMQLELTPDNVRAVFSKVVPNGWMNDGLLTIVQMNDNTWRVVVNSTSIIFDIIDLVEVRLQLEFAGELQFSSGLNEVIDWLKANLGKAPMVELSTIEVEATPWVEKPSSLVAAGFESLPEPEPYVAPKKVEPDTACTKSKPKPKAKSKTPKKGGVAMRQKSQDFKEFDTVLRLGSIISEKPARKKRGLSARRTHDELITSLMPWIGSVPKEQVLSLLKMSPADLINSVTRYKGTRYVTGINAGIEIRQSVVSRRRVMILKSGTWQVEMLSTTSRRSNLATRFAWIGDESNDIQAIAQIIKLLAKVVK